MSSVSGFLTKTYGIFSDKAHQDICGWGPNGDTIQVRKIDEFSKKILPKYFKHSNFQSFVRQLNMYDFHKTVQDPGNGEFQHVYFLKDRPDLLHLIKRKANSRSAEGKPKLPVPQPVVDAIPKPLSVPGPPESVFLSELGKQQALRVDLEKWLADLEAQKKRMAELEAQQSRLTAENVMLKRMLTDARDKQADLTQKMEGVLKFLYHIFVSTGRTIATKGPLNGISESHLVEFWKYLQLEGQVRRNSLEETTSKHPIIQMNSSNSGQPIEKIFSFDSFANAITFSHEKCPVMRKESLERPGETEADIVVAKENGLALCPSKPYESASCAGTIVSRGDIFTASRKRSGSPDVEEQNKRRNCASNGCLHPQQQDVGTVKEAAPEEFVKQDSIETSLSRFCSMDSTLASLLSFDEDGLLVDDINLSKGDDEKLTASNNPILCPSQ
eukprot:CAMPEP_0185035024 /NCGR_PEP_ID=MMETSP1103-20130426/25689_1 /TAXON_ID=36769 /ORGANISM="Paraphysomonas bandaiensis, Strain Caron Lab Isolate" /LENGTH=441 /DNA_ID=CAMNT_0027571927 /DNA_START=134 /DNA_END=1459 /DNA_ORIENTATION=+